MCLLFTFMFDGSKMKIIIERTEPTLNAFTFNHLFLIPYYCIANQRDIYAQSDYSVEVCTEQMFSSLFSLEVC